MSRGGLEEVAMASLMMLAGCILVMVVGRPIMRFILMQILW